MTHDQASMLINVLSDLLQNVMLVKGCVVVIWLQSTVFMITVAMFWRGDGK